MIVHFRNKIQNTIFSRYIYDKIAPLRNKNYVRQVVKAVRMKRCGEIHFIQLSMECRLHI